MSVAVSLQQLSNIGGLTGTQQSVIAGLSNLVGGFAQSIFGTQTPLGPAPASNSGIPYLSAANPQSYSAAPVTSTAQYYSGSYALPDSLSVSSVMQSLPTLSLYPTTASGAYA
jgi:hypothetical protein